jgi:hypothetical protein
MSTGGQLGTCYHALYALAFLPLVLLAIGVIVWGLIVLWKSSLVELTPLRNVYGGLGPYTSAVCPNVNLEETALVWEHAPELLLRVVPNDEVLKDASGTASKYVKSVDSRT